MIEQVNEIEKYLIEKGADFSDVRDFNFAGLHLIEIPVTWGDWKHSHRYLDYLMGAIGWGLLKNELTEEDGSDCYSSVHTYYNQNDEEIVAGYRRLFKMKDE